MLFDKNYERMNLKCCLSLLLFVVALGLQAQISPIAPQKTGIQTRLPSETLDVAGTVRIQDLTVNGKIYNGQNVKNTTHTPISYVVADENGVLGVVPISEYTDAVDWIYLPPIYPPISRREMSGVNFNNIVSVQNSGSSEVYTIRLDYWARNQLVFAPRLSPVYGSTTHFVKSPSASDDLGYSWFYSYEMNVSRDCYFYVAYYDPEVFQNVSIVNGTLSYTVKPNAVATSKTYMTIVAKIPARSS